MRLTFDWDNRGLEDIIVQDGLAKLSQDFPQYDVYYRLSASSFGIHAMISYQDVLPPRPVEMDDPQVLDYRRVMVDFGLEDEWRLWGDVTRLKTGLPTAQLWEWKDGEKAGEWIKYVE